MSTVETEPSWPENGRCGACGRPARRYPSGRWSHTGRPCRARSQTLWRVDDVHIKHACRFILDGEPLPAEPDRYRMDPTGEPDVYAVSNSDRLETVREFLAREAEEAAR